MRAATLTRLLASALTVAGLAGCGDVLRPKSGLSQGQVDALMRQFANAYANGMASAHPQVAAVGLLQPAGSGFGAGAPLSTLGQVNISVQQRTNCTAGGNITVSGNMTGNIDDRGSGVLLTQITETITDWKCVAGLVVNGDPYVSAAGTFSFLNGQQSSAASITFGGGFKWTGTSSGSCQLQMTFLFNANGGGRLTGQACGRSVDLSV